MYFINDDQLDGWKCGSSPLTVNLIMAWADIRNSIGYERIPRLTMVEKNNMHYTAEIRVKFEGGLCSV